MQEVQHGPILLYDVYEKSERLFVHRRTQLAVEAGKPLPIDRIVLLESSDIEPLADELRREILDAFVLQHPLRLRGQNVWPTQLAGGSFRQQLGIGQAGPQEITQPAGQ